MTRDFADFLAPLNSEGAAYVVIGGLAVVFHVPYRTTRDIDVLIEPTIENARRVRRAVQRWGGFEPEFSEDEFIAGDILFVRRAAPRRGPLARSQRHLGPSLGAPR